MEAVRVGLVGRAALAASTSSRSVGSTLTEIGTFIASPGFFLPISYIRFLLTARRIVCTITEESRRGDGCFAHRSDHQGKFGLNRSFGQALTHELQHPFQFHARLVPRIPMYRSDRECGRRSPKSWHERRRVGVHVGGIRMARIFRRPSLGRNHTARTGDYRAYFRDGTRHPCNSPAVGMQGGGASWRCGFARL